MKDFTQPKSKATEKLDMKCSSCGVMFRVYGVAEGDPCRNPDKSDCPGTMREVNAKTADAMKRLSDNRR